MHCQGWIGPGDNLDNEMNLGRNIAPEQYQSQPSTLQPTTLPSELAGAPNIRKGGLASRGNPDYLMNQAHVLYINDTSHDQNKPKIS